MLRQIPRWVLLAALVVFVVGLRVATVGDGKPEQFSGADTELYLMDVQALSRLWDDTSEDAIVGRGHEVCEIGRAFAEQPDVMLEEMERRWPDIAAESVWPFARIAAVYMCEAELGLEILAASRA